LSQTIDIPTIVSAAEMGTGDRDSGRRGVAEFALSLSASLGTFVFFSVQGILLARLLGPEMRGAFAAAVLFPQALLYLGLLGASELMAGYAARGLPDTELRRSAARYGAFAGLLSLALCIALDWFLLPGEFRQVLPLALLCAMTLPLQQIRLSVQAIDHGQRNMTRYNVTRLISAAAFPLTLAIGALFGLHDIRWCCIWLVVSQVLSFLLIQWGMRGSWMGPSAVPLKSGLRDARGLIVAWLSNELLERLDVMILLLVASRETLGFYAAAAPMAAAMIIVPNTMGLYAFNRGARIEEIPSLRDAWRFLLGAMAAQIVCAIALGALLPIFVKVLYGKDFAQTVYFAWLLLPAGAFKGLLQATDSYARARGKPSLGIRARLMCIPVLLAVAWGGYSYWGTYSIPIGLSLAQFVCFVLVARSVLLDVHEHARQAP